MSNFTAFNVETTDLDFSDGPMLFPLEKPALGSSCDLCTSPAEVLVDATSEIGEAGHDLLFCEPHFVGWTSVHNHKLSPKG